MKYEINYEIKLLAPLVISKAENSGNEVKTVDYISGTIIQGVFAKKLKQDIKKYLFNDNICFLNAYLKIDDERALPVPKSFQLPKVKPSDVPINTITIKNFDNYNEHNNVKYKSIDSGYVILKNQQIIYNRVSTISDMHNYVINKNELLSKKLIKRKAVFTFNGISKESVFKGKIIFDEEQTFVEEFYNKIKNLNNIYIGKSKKSQYGKCKIKFGGVQNYQPETASASDSSSTITLTLLSDLVIYDENLNSSTDFSVDFINAELSKLDIDKRAVKITKRITFNDFIDGFNAHHGLPKTIFSVIEKGSVIVIEFDKPLTEEDIIKIEKYGIGEKKNHGFGRVAVNWDIHKVNESKELFSKFDDLTKKDDDDGSKQWYEVESLEGNWRDSVFNKKIEDNIIAASINLYNKNKRDFKNKPTSSQLQGLKNFALNAKDIESIKKFLNDKIGKKAEKNGDWDCWVIYENNNDKKIINFITDIVLEKHSFYKLINLMKLNDKDKNRYFKNSAIKFIIIFINYIIKNRNKEV